MKKNCIAKYKKKKNNNYSLNRGTLIIKLVEIGEEKEGKKNERNYAKFTDISIGSILRTCPLSIISYNCFGISDFFFHFLTSSIYCCIVRIESVECKHMAFDDKIIICHILHDIQSQ